MKKNTKGKKEINGSKIVFFFPLEFQSPLNSVHKHLGGVVGPYAQSPGFIIKSYCTYYILDFVHYKNMSRDIYIIELFHPLGVIHWFDL